MPLTGCSGALAVKAGSSCIRAVEHPTDSNEQTNSDAMERSEGAGMAYPGEARLHSDAR